MEVLDQTDNQPLVVSDLEEKDAEHAPIIQDSKSCFKARYTFGFMGFLGLTLVYAMRLGISIAIVSMVNQTQTEDNNDRTNTSDICPNNTRLTNVTIIPSTGEFNWDDSDKGIVLGAFAIGYVFTSVPGGRMAEKYGGKLVFGLGVVLTAVLTVISPFAAYWGLVPFILFRVAKGLAAGVTLPAMQSMLAHWVPRLERSKFSATVYTGMNFGTVITLPLTGWLCSLEIFGGWPLAFYLFGGLSIVWYVFWLILVFDSPSQHPRIDLQEKAYIESSVEPKYEDEESGVPWRAIFTSVPMWAIVIPQCGQAWCLCTLLLYLPTYMEEVLHFDMQQIAYLSMLPYLGSWIVGVGVSVLADALLARNFWTPLASMKFWNTISSFGPSLGFIGAIWAGCNRNIVLALLVSLGSLQGVVYAGNQVNHIALAPRYVGTLFGMTNAASSIAAILAPFVVGFIIQGHETLARWHTTFWLAAVINIGTNLFYVIFASAKEQPWSKGRN